MSESRDDLRARIEFQAGQIEKLLAIYSDVLDRARGRPPDLIEVTAIASVLHSFYNGLESIFLLIARDVDEQAPAGPQWHRDLLVLMSTAAAARPEVISPKQVIALSGYLSFRHFYRHSYSFMLEWNQMAPLVQALPEVWGEVHVRLRSFSANLSRN